MKSKEISPFYQQVYDIVALIPKGRVTSYGAIAKALGAPRSARLVGYAMNNSHQFNPQLPAHRVVNRKGLLTGQHHFHGTPMQTLLENEGIVIKDLQIQNFDLVFWDPLENL